MKKIWCEMGMTDEIRAAALKASSRLGLFLLEEQDYENEMCGRAAQWGLFDHKTKIHGRASLSYAVLTACAERGPLTLAATIDMAIRMTHKLMQEEAKRRAEPPRVETLKIGDAMKLAGERVEVCAFLGDYDVKLRDGRTVPAASLEWT